jgi:hypothetical protein
MSEKSWVEDPQGVRWETFLTTGESTVYGSELASKSPAAECCVPRMGFADSEIESPCCTPAERARAIGRKAACCA